MSETQATAPVVQLRGVGKTFSLGDDDSTVALNDINLDIGRGEFVSLIGPSGCGKSTLLRTIGDLIEPSTGTVQVNAKPAKRARLDREYGMVFQAPVLFDWRTVEENVQLPLELFGQNRAARTQRAVEMLELVGLSDFARHHPYQLSGGMQQRVAIARAIAYAPRILLMDEPFASVDAQTRADLQDLLLTVWRRHDSTVLFVTHDIDESLYLSDRVVLLSRPPTVVEAEISVALPRPRHQIDTRASDAFVALRSELATRLMRPDAGGPAR